MGRPFNPVSSPTPKPASPMVASTPPTSSRPSSPPPVRRHPHFIRPMLTTFADTPEADRHAFMRHAHRQAAELSRFRHDRDRHADRRRRRTIVVNNNSNNNNNSDSPAQQQPVASASPVIQPTPTNAAQRRYVRLLREPHRAPRARRPGQVSAPLSITPAVIPPAASSVHQFAYSVLSMHLSRCSQWLRAEKRASSRLLSDTSRFPNNPDNPDDPFYAYYNAFCDAYFDSLIQSNDRLQTQIRQRLADPTNDPRFPNPIPFSEQSVRAFANDVARDVAAVNSNAVEAVLRISRDPPSSIPPLNPNNPTYRPLINVSPNSSIDPNDAPTTAPAAPTAPAATPSTPSTTTPPNATGNTAPDDNPDTDGLDPWWLRHAFSRIQNLQQQSNDMLEAIEATTAQSRAAAEQLSTVCGTYARMVSRLGTSGDPLGVPLRLGSSADTATDSDEGVPEGDVTPDSHHDRDSEPENMEGIGANGDDDPEATARVSLIEVNEVIGWDGAMEGNSGDDDEDD